MGNIWHNIKSRYDGRARLILAHGLFFIALHVIYRFRIYRYIQDIYADLKLRGFTEYLGLGLHVDSVVIFYTLALVSLAFLILGGFRKIIFTVMTFTQVLLVFFMLFSMEFFRVYETTFQKNFAGREHFTGLGNVLDSALAEFSAEFYLLFFLFSAVAFIMNLVLYRRENYDHLPPIAGIHQEPANHPVPGYTIPVLLAVFLFTSLATYSSVPGDSFARRYSKDSKRKISMLREFSMNPVFNFFSSGTARSTGQDAPGATGEAPFSFRLDTSSLATSRHYPRMNAIPRRKKYNIILYFFESTPRRYYDLKIGDTYVIDTWRRLENNSLNFRNHYANYPLSANALMSVFLSAYDLNSKDMVIQKYPDIRLSSLSEILKDRGYRTCLIHTGGLGYAGQKRFLKNRRFDEIIEFDDLMRVPPYNRQVGWGVDERAMITPAVQFIKKRPGKPFFMVLLPVNPHHPYAIPDDTFRITGAVPDDATSRNRSWLNYLNSLHYSDVSLGMLVDRLERENLMEDTLLFLFADHGEAFYQHKMNYNHPLFIYNENVHVPFLIYNRTIFSSAEYFDGLTRHIDISPTILDVLGIPLPREHEGVPVLAPHREQLALLHTSWKDDYMGVADQQWKYIYRTADGMEELYNLEKDPHERRNIAPEEKLIAGRYRDFVLKARGYKDAYYRRVLKSGK